MNPFPVDLAGCVLPVTCCGIICPGELNRKYYRSGTFLKATQWLHDTGLSMAVAFRVLTDLLRPVHSGGNGWTAYSCNAQTLNELCKNQNITLQAVTMHSISFWRKQI